MSQQQHRATIPIVIDDFKPVHTRIEPRSSSLSKKDPDPTKAKFHFTREKLYVETTPINGWQLRDRFLSWPLEDWQRFFEISGSWEVRESPFNISSSWEVSGYVGYGDFTRDDFAEWQRLLRAALIRHAKDWKTLDKEFDRRKSRLLYRTLPVRFEWDGQVPAVRIVNQNALMLMIATIQVDKLEGATFRQCARHDCTNPPFRVKAHQKFYCGPDCAHLAAVRKWRERKRAEESAEKKQQGKGKKNHGTQKTR